MKVTRLILCLLVFVVSATAQVTIRQNRAYYVDPADGQQLYKSFCSSCHGQNLTGNTAVKQSIPGNLDLTQLARLHPRNAEHRIRYQIEHGSIATGHPAPMPEWRKILRYSGEQMMANRAMGSLTSYIMSKQQ